MDGYHFDTLLDLSPVQFPPVRGGPHPAAKLPWWRGASEGMWGLLVLVVIGACSFAAIILLSGVSLTLAGV